MRLDPSGFMAALERRKHLNKLPLGKPLYARIIREVANEVKYNRETGADHEAYLAQQQLHLDLQERTGPNPLSDVVEDTMKALNLSRS